MLAKGAALVGALYLTRRARLDREAPLPLYRERYPALKTLDQYYGPPGGPARPRLRSFRRQPSGLVAAASAPGELPG